MKKQQLMILKLIFKIKGDLKRRHVNDINKLENELKKIIKMIPKKIYNNCFNHSYKSITGIYNVFRNFLYVPF